MNKDVQTSPVWPYGAAILLVLAIAISGIYFLFSNYFSRGELSTKSYYAALQGVEFENRGDKNPNPILKMNVDGTRLNILGVIGRDSSKTRVWVILNQVSPDGLPLVMPQGIPIDANCGLIMNIISNQQVAKPVRQYLLRECLRR
jgi:hypothetical protein